MSRDELLDKVDAGFDDLMAAVSGLTDKQMSQPWFGEWGVRDILAHVAGWHREMVGAFERIAAGERPVPEGTDYSDADKWNAKFSEAKRSAKALDIITEVKASQKAFVDAARRVPEDRFAEGKTANRILHTTGIDHYLEHLPAIREWRQKEGI